MRTAPLPSSSCERIVRTLLLFRYAVTLLDSAGSFGYTRDELRHLDDSMRSEVNRLGGNKGLQDLLDELRNWDVNEKN